MTSSAHKLSPSRWRTLRVLAALAWLAMVVMPAMMPVHAAGMSAPPTGATAMQHDTSEQMAGCCAGAPNQNANSHGCHCAATCGAVVVLPGAGPLAELWAVPPQWRMMSPAVMQLTSSPPYRPPRI